MQRGYLLVVEDDAALRELYATALEDEGHLVDSAGSAEEAIGFLERSRPDAVITDVTMSGMTGIDLIRYVRENYPATPPPIIAVSGFHAVRNEALRVGAICFLEKPVDRRELIEAVQAALHGNTYSEAEYASGRQVRRAGARALAEAAIEVVLQHDPEMEQRAATAARWLSRYIGACTALLLVPREHEFQVLVASDELRFRPGRAPEGLAALGADVVETRSTLVLPDCAPFRISLESFDSHTCGVIAVPFFAHDAVVGALCLLSAEARVFGGAEVALLEHLAQRATEWASGRPRQPVLSPAGLISHTSFRELLRSEIGDASRHPGQAVSLALARLECDLERADGMQILQSCTERRTLIGELGRRKLAIAIRGETERVQSTAGRVFESLRSKLPLGASAHLLVGDPVPASAEAPMLEWASLILAEAEQRPPGTALFVDAVPHSRPLELPQQAR